MPGTGREVLFVTLSDISGSSGNSIATKEIVKAFIRNDGVDLTLVCPEPMNTMPAAIAESDINVYNLGSRDDPSVARRIVEQIELFGILRLAVSVSDPDFIVARLNPTLLAPPIFARLRGIPYVLLARGTSYKHLRFSSVLGRIFWINARLADQVYAAYKEVKDDADAARCPAQPESKVFANAVDPDLFSTMPIEAARTEIDVGLDESGFVLGSVSTLKPYHVVDEVIHAVGELRPEKDVKLLIVGDGPEREKLEALTRSKRLTDSVEFTGFVPHEQVYKYIASADILYGANKTGEAGNPLKCYEYLACGRPIIATATPEFSFVEERDFGVTIEETERDSIGNAITELYERDAEQRRRMGAHAREYVLENHTWEAMVDEILTDVD